MISRFCRDAAEIVLWIHERNPDAATRFSDAVNDALRRLDDHPELGARFLEPSLDLQPMEFAVFLGPARLMSIDVGNEFRLKQMPRRKQIGIDHHEVGKSHLRRPLDRLCDRLRCVLSPMTIGSS